jgi:hypothetical protein
MAKVFRLYKEGADIQDWEKRNEHYTPSEIDGIENPDGDYSKNDPTSIPSPFARIDLFRSAFQYVANKQDLDDETIYHKLVSNSFDVAEMFFNIDKYGDKIKIKTWDKSIDLQKLVASNNTAHKLLGDTLSLFLNQDAKTNNFNKLQKMYFILFDNKIIGGTSPSTMFYSSANDLSFVNLNNGNDILFDSNYTPLYKRDPEFQKYIYMFFRAFSPKMRDFSEYLEQNLKSLDELNKPLYNEIYSINETSPEEVESILNNEFDDLDTGIAGDNIEILGFPLKKKKNCEQKTCNSGK